MLERHCWGFRCRRHMVSLTFALLYIRHMQTDEQHACIHSSSGSCIAKSYVLRVLGDTSM